MRKIIFGIGVLTCIFSALHAGAFTASYHVAATDIRNGYISEKIWLTQNAKPEITLSGLQYQNNVMLPQGALPSSPDKFDVALGMERKRPFIIIHIPAYAATSASQVNQLSDFTVTFTEDASPARSAARTTDVTTSVLSTGTWYKIAVTSTGFYKIDYNFLSKLGVDPASFNTADVRVFGNGGHMLSENNAVPRINDLAENAVWMNDGGDGKFDQNDFLVFYAAGPNEWDKDSINQRFTHQNNLYSDTSYYFINFDLGQSGLRIAGQQGSLTGNQTVTTFNDYAVHDTDIVNPGTLGREWYGEQFGAPGQNNTQTFQFNFGTAPTSIYCSLLMGSVSSNSGNVYTVSMNGQPVGTQSIFANNSNPADPVAEVGPLTATVPLNSQTATFTINFQPSDNNTSGYLNYIELNMRRPLGITSAQMNFRDWQSVGAGNIATYQLQGANSATQVWDVTNPQVPVKMNGTLNNSTFSFTQDAQMLHEFAAMNSTDLYTPSYAGTVPNQNLHGMGQADMIIVAYPGFLDAANQLASYHEQHDNLKVAVATTVQIYNEFSSGAQDISAIRDFARMFYKRAGNDTTQIPKYLLLYGGASFDYKNRVANNSNYVPIFESPESHNEDANFCTDDFYGFLDDNENIENPTMANALDIAVGRIPARNSTDALAMVNKVQVYESTASLGAWRIADIFTAEKEDEAGDHLADAEYMDNTVTASSNNLYNASKAYVDVLPLVITPAGNRCPDANAIINGQIYKGAFLINYNGHGSQQVWANERILTQDDFNNWNSLTSMPLLISATCEFGQFDQPSYVSAGEQVMLKNNGGAIADLITTQATFENENKPMNEQYLAAQFTRLPNGNYNTFGESYRIGKNVTYATATAQGELANYRKFSFLGDPAIVPDFPQYNIVIDSLKDAIAGQVTDTLKALGSYTLSGSVRDLSNNTITTFNGTVSISFYDKPTTSKVQTSQALETFSVQDNIIYKGKATVTNGLFSVSFIAPKDINYAYGKGKISTYADNGITDAAGADTSTTVGDFSDNPVLSSNGPVVKPYMNDSLFQNGGITGTNSVLYVSLFDETGINVSGNTVGHDLVGILDGNETQPYVLNDYYQSYPNTYQNGYVYFPISGLTNGKHSITVRAWDVNDNSGEGTVDFVVTDSSVMQISNLVNYPNPFTDITHFVFEHNHPNEEMDVQINIYNTEGVFVRNIKQSFTPSGSRTEEITWDGTDNAGSRLPSGLYVYRLNLSTPSGIQATAYQKLVLIR